MILRNAPIRKKLMTVILMTSGAVLLLTCIGFFTYELIIFRKDSVRQLSTLGEITAANSTAALAFKSKPDADEILGALKAEKYIVAACLYDADGNVFSTYPSGLSEKSFPALPTREGYRFEDSYLTGTQPVMIGDRRIGTLYIKSSMDALYERLRLYTVIAILIMAVSLALAYVLSYSLQQTISKPVMALAEAAQTVSENHTYSVRVEKWGNDELGLLTDAFNHMLTQVQEQSLAVNTSKERLENIVESMGDAYVSLDRDWRYTFVNGKALTLMEKNSADLLGKTLWEVFPDTVGTMFEEKYRQVMTERKPAQFELHYPSYNMWLEVRCYPHEEGIAIFYTDITKYKQAEETVLVFNQQLEEKIQERTEALEAANKELESFSYSVSHDLRAPLRAINGYMNIFAEDYSSQLDDEARRIMGIILNNSKKMGLLIDDLLAFSKMGKKELVKTRVSMRDMVATLWEDMKREENNREIEFNLRDLPEAFADQATLQQVWANLISNALKYTRQKKKAVIEVGTETIDGEVVYYVRDNGAGFDMQYYNKLFGVFQRLHSQEDFEGTGVGLALVQRIIAKHGGKIWAKAKLNEGAAFFFTLAKNFMQTTTDDTIN